MFYFKTFELYHNLRTRIYSTSCETQKAINTHLQRQPHTHTKTSSRARKAETTFAARCDALRMLLTANTIYAMAAPCCTSFCRCRGPVRGCLLLDASTTTTITPTPFAVRVHFRRLLNAVSSMTRNKKTPAHTGADATALFGYPTRSLQLVRSFSHPHSKALWHVFWFFIQHV